MVLTRHGAHLQLDVGALIAQTERNLARGFRAIKMKVGRDRLSEDVERVRAMRGRLGAESEAFAQHLAGLAPLAVRAMKQILGGIARGAVDATQAARLAQRCAGSRDLQEGLAAQREKRAPRFTGE